MLSETALHTANMQEEKQLLQWMSYMHLKDKAELFTALVAENFN